MTYKKKKIFLVIPAYNEEKLIIPTLIGVPNYVDSIIVVNDKSTDRTVELITKYSKEHDKRILVVNHEKNQGVGQGVITGAEKAINMGADIIVFVGGDNQFDLTEMERFIEPIIENKADYVKGNRIKYGGNAITDMPKQRKFGNFFLSLLTIFFAGTWKIFDTQDGYLSISSEFFKKVQWDSYWKGYGFVSDFIIRIIGDGGRIMDVPRRAIYIEGETQSQIKVKKYIGMIFKVMLRAWLYRIKKQYIVRFQIPSIFIYSNVIFVFLNFLLLKLDLYFYILIQFGLILLFLIIDAVNNIKLQPRYRRYLGFNALDIDNTPEHSLSEWNNNKIYTEINSNKI